MRKEARVRCVRDRAWAHGLPILLFAGAVIAISPSGICAARSPVSAVSLLCASEYEAPCSGLASALLAHLGEYRIEVELALVEHLPENFYDQMEAARVALKTPGTVAVLWLDVRLNSFYLLIAPHRSANTSIPVTEQLISRQLPNGGIERLENAELIAALARSCLASWLERRSHSPIDHRQDSDMEDPTERIRIRRANSRQIVPFTVTPEVGFAASPLTDGGNWLAGSRIGIATAFMESFGTSVQADVYWPGQLPLPTVSVYESYRFSFRFSSHLYRKLGTLGVGLSTFVSIDVVPTLDETREQRRVLPVLGVALQLSRVLGRYLQLWGEIGLGHPLKVVSFTHEGDIIDQTATLWPHMALGVGIPLRLGGISTPASRDPNQRWPER